MKSLIIGMTTLFFSLHHTSAAIVQNCTASVCDLQTCTNTSSVCKQYCYTSDCKMACSSTAGCESDCVNGGCAKLSCDVPGTTPQQSLCSLSCEESCPDMKCVAKNCHLKCKKKGCKLNCESSGQNTQCYPRCHGGGCEITVKSFYTEVDCSEGSCNVKCGKSTSQARVSCQKGRCTLTCAKGSVCGFLGSCPNCTGPVYVDDPFSTGSAHSNRALTILGLFSLFLLTATAF